MANDMFDPKMYKHVKSDKNTTTLQHKKGHTITIAHNVISPKMRTALQALSSLPSQAATSNQAQESEDQSQYGKVIMKADGGKIHETNRKQIQAAKQLYPEPSIEEKQKLAAKHKTQDQFMRNTAGKSMKVEYADGGDVEPKTFLGQTIYGTGRSQPKPPEHEGSAPGSNDEEWPLPSQTSVGKAIQAKKDQAPAMDAKGGKVRYADGTDYVHAADQEGGGAHYDASQAPAPMPSREPSYIDAPGEKPEYDDSPGEMLQSAPAGIGKPAQDIAKVQQVVPRIAELDPAQKGIMQAYNYSLTQGGTNVVPENMLFNENTGAPPVHVDMQKLQNAKTMHDYNTKRDAETLQNNQQKVIKDNELRQASGLMPEPVPTASGMQGLPGFENAHGIDDGSNPPAGQYNPYDYAPAQEPVQGQAQQNPNGLTGDPGTDFNTGVNQSLEGMQARQEAEQQIGAGRVAAANKYEEAIQKANTVTQAEWQQNYNEHQAIVKEMNEGKIDPNKFWTGDKNGNGGHSKIMSAIGLIVSGFGAGLAHQSNAALDHLHFQMNQNLEGQRMNLGRQQGLLASNLQHYGNINDAMAASRITQNMVMANDLEKAASSATNPMAKAALLENAGKLRRDTAPMEMTFAMQRAMMNLNGGKGGAPADSPEAQAHMISQMMAIAPEKAKVYQQAFVPGVGLSKSLQPIPETVRNQIGAYNTSLDQIQQAIDFKQSHPGAAFSPQDRATANTLMTNIGNQVRVAEDMGVFKQSEATMMKTLLGNSPATFFSEISTNPKLREMLRLKQQEQENLHKTWDLPAPKRSEPAQTTQTVIRVTPDGRKAIFNAATRQFLGYQK